MIRSGSAGSTSKSIISPRGVNSSVNVLPPSLEISIADRMASNAYRRSWRRTILCRSASPSRETTLQVLPPSSERSRPRKFGSVAERVGVAAAEQLARTGAADLEERPDGCGLALGGDVPLIGVTLLPSWSDPPEAAVGGQQEVAVGGVDVERVDDGGFLEKSTSRGEGAFAGAAGGGSSPPQPPRSSEREQRGAAPHEPACASSHSASVVNPIMIPSIQYWERTAIRA